MRTSVFSGLAAAALMTLVGSAGENISGLAFAPAGSAVPEPASCGMMLLGGAGVMLGVARRRK